MEKNEKLISVLYEFMIFSLLAAGIFYYKPSIFLYIPLLVSVVIMFFQSKVNRFAFLIGGINAVLYAVSYVKMSLYSTALYALVISCPLQLMTFFNWNKHTKKNKTELKEMTLKKKTALLLCMIFGFLLLYTVFLKFNSQYLFFDNCISVLGIVASVLCLLRFKEYIFLQILCNAISLVTFLIMIKNEPSRIIWVINSANAVISSCVALKNMNKKENLV